MQPALRPAILLVDDDATLLTVLARRLAREGFEVRTATSGHAGAGDARIGLAGPAGRGPDDAAAWTASSSAERVKRIADLPIIVLSAVDACESKVRALEEYAEDYITKPFDPDELVARIQRVLRRTPAGPSDDDARGRGGGDRLRHTPPRDINGSASDHAHRKPPAAGVGRARSTASSPPIRSWTGCGRSQTAPIPPTSG